MSLLVDMRPRCDACGKRADTLKECSTCGCMVCCIRDLDPKECYACELERRNGEIPTWHNLKGTDIELVTNITP